MKLTIRTNLESDGERIVEIWRTSVDATHDFLTPEDRIEIDQLVSEHMPKAKLELAVDEADFPLAFLMVDGSKIEALFVAGDRLGQGIGNLLMRHALEKHGACEVDVNEQNPGAIGFYQHWGFVPTGRSDTDDEGRPYPLIHMSREN